VFAGEHSSKKPGRRDWQSAQFAYALQLILIKQMAIALKSAFEHSPEVIRKDISHELGWVFHGLHPKELQDLKLSDAYS
jgi:hypothetical protein